MLKGIGVPVQRLRSPFLRRATATSPSLLICKSSMSETPKPILPSFVSLPDNDKTAQNPTHSGYKFRLVSYNILAQIYVKSIYFSHSPSSCLKWKARSQAVLTHLKDFGADFLCLQELDEYNSFYKKNMEGVGYSTIYIQRTGGKRDGCGIFYKQSSAEVLLTEEIHYNDLVDQLDPSSLNRTKSEADVADDIRKLDISSTNEKETKKKASKGDPNDPRVRLKRDCVGLLAAFKLNHPSNPLIIVANTHIYWDPDWADVKLAQVKYLLSRLSKFRELVSSRFNSVPSVILVGDFNSTPGDQVYNYLVSQGSDASNEVAPIKLSSLYGANGGEPEFTNCTPGFTGTLDYIFLSCNSNRLKPVSLLHVPGPDAPDAAGGLPNYFHPSDHLPIGADFELSSIS
ncbi:carbon catabolite repressor protein 4 4 isoform X1 [Carex littledalei]|uniref:Carbon catabolite repressor protein 4 4 isoform X1 n=1 Tax=Carex littledalei TaxID=544730 RepID=A0A833VUN8_9POAL|nr:carbon catabolite repressor protein 4 4 isoform X1 [Carex littledalei]